MFEKVQEGIKKFGKTLDDVSTGVSESKDSINQHLDNIEGYAKSVSEDFTRLVDSTISLETETKKQIKKLDFKANILIGILILNVIMFGYIIYQNTQVRDYQASTHIEAPKDAR